MDIIESGENQRPDLPNCGYLVTVRDPGVSFLHTGDLTEPYRALEKLRGRVTYLIHMKLGLTEWGGEDRTDKLLQCIDAVQPEFLIPIHYRTDRASDPIPHGTWPPDVTDVGAFIEWIREAAGSQNPRLALHGGRWNTKSNCPRKRVLWKWNWFNTWTTPSWRNDRSNE